jgi:hypothetical protein
MWYRVLYPTPEIKTLRKAFISLHGDKMSTTDEVSGVFDVINTEERVAPQPTATETKTETPADTPKAEEPEVKQPETKTEDEADNEERTDVQDFNREPKDEATTETKTEPLQTETKTDTPAEAEEIDWTATLPPPPPIYKGIAPEIDEETGQLKNMTALEYAQYIQDKTLNAAEQRSYVQLVENRALEAAEKILPDIKTSPAVRTLVENTRTASIINGQQIDSYEAAKIVREALGLAPERLAKATAEARTQGAQSAKVSIEVQKRSQVETGGATQKPKAPSKADKLDKRLKAGDDSAFAELFTIMEEEGKLGR